MNFEQQIAYNSWANKRILDAIGASLETKEDKELLKHFGHILQAQIIWFNRVMEIEEDVNVWPEFTLDECLNILSGDSAIDLNEMVKKVGQLCSYTNTKGMKFESKVEYIIQHVIIHSQHHRAQISLLLRQKGITPPATDLIFFTRQT